MEEEQKMEFKAEGDPAFPAENTEKDNSADSSTEKTDTDQTQSQEGEQNSGEKKDDGAKDSDDSLDEHPRWQQREKDWDKRFNDQEKRHVDEISKLREDLEKRFNSKDETEEDGAPTEVPPWFGGDEGQWKEFVKWNKTLFGQVKTEALQEIESKSAEEQKRIEEATTYFTDQVKVIESDKIINPKGEKVDRNKLLKFVLDNELVDTKGRWNYRAGFQMMRAGIVNSNAKTIDEKKKVAGQTITDKHSEAKAEPFMTSDDFKKPGARPW